MFLIFPLILLFLAQAPHYGYMAPAPPNYNQGFYAGGGSAEPQQQRGHPNPAGNQHQLPPALPAVPGQAGPYGPQLPPGFLRPNGD